MKYRTRNENGWKIPREGTFTREVYDLLILGGSLRTIYEQFPARNRRTIEALISHIKNPESRNAYSRRYYGLRAKNIPKTFLVVEVMVDKGGAAKIGYFKSQRDALLSMWAMRGDAIRLIYKDGEFLSGPGPGDLLARAKEIAQRETNLPAISNA